MGGGNEDFEKRQQALAQGNGREATAGESADWFIGHLHAGLHEQKYSFPRSNGPYERIHTIARDIDLPTLHGDLALTIIVPPGVNVRYTDLGDNKLLFAEDFSKSNKWDGPLPIAPPVLEELTKRDYWAEAFIFAEPDDDANARLGKTAAARSEAKNWKERKAVSKAEPAPASAMTAEDWVRAQQLPRTGKEPEMSTDPWVQAQLNALGPAKTEAQSVGSRLVKGLFKAFNFGAARGQMQSSGSSAMASTPVSSGPKQKAPTA